MALSLQNIEKNYGDHAVIVSLSHTFPEYGVCVLCGPSGSGKTTLLRIIAGLEQQDGGTVTGGEEAAMSFQEYRLFPQLSALKNVTALCRNPKEMETSAKEMLSHLGFSPADMLLKPAALSGGMKQRVSLCRALIGAEKLVLLDEPLREMDEALRQAVMQMIAKKSETSLVILSAHETDELAMLRPEILKI